MANGLGINPYSLRYQQGGVSAIPTLPSHPMIMQQAPQQSSSENELLKALRAYQSMAGGGRAGGLAGLSGSISPAIASSLYGGSGTGAAIMAGAPATGVAGTGAFSGTALAGLLGESAGAGAMSSLGIGSGAGASAAGGLGAAMASNPVGWVLGGLSAPFVASSDPETFGSLGAVGTTGEALNGLWSGKGLTEFFDTDNLATHFIPGADLTNTLGITKDADWDFLNPVSDIFGDIFGF